MKTWDGFETIAEKMENLVSKFVTLGEKVYTPSSPNEGYSVLNHGDFHFNNMLFKNFANGKLSDVNFVSFFDSLFTLNENRLKISRSTFN